MTLKLTTPLYALILTLSPLAHSLVQIENECFYKLDCGIDTLNELTDEELTYIVKASDIVAKDRLTLEEYIYLHPLTREWKISMAQLFDIEYKAYRAAKNEKLSIAAFMFDIEAALHELKYDFANKHTLEEQIKAYQADTDQAVTGVITFGQYHRATELAKITTPNTIHLSGSGQARDDDDYVRASGSWDTLGENEVFPINRSYIECEKSTLKCTEKHKRFETHEEKFGLTLPLRTYFLYEGVDFYNVISWDNEVIIAKPITNSTCHSVILNINYVTGKVQKVANNKTRKCLLPKLEAPRISELVRSTEFHLKYWRKLRNNILCTKAKSYISKIQELRAASNETRLECKPLNKI